MLHSKKISRSTVSFSHAFSIFYSYNVTKKFLQTFTLQCTILTSISSTILKSTRPNKYVPKIIIQAVFFQWKWFNSQGARTLGEVDLKLCTSRRSPRRRNLTFLLRIFSEKPVGRFWFRATLSQSASDLKFRAFKVLSLSRAFNKPREDTAQRRNDRKRRNEIWRPGDVRIPCVIINRTKAARHSLDEATSETR